eukprot:TRINITY_DN6361_c0_g1_i1.p1 TRINITY_DN6361_c0_g1~~TRINITY_DN6361_c0_g1_i1.p1  ORF type:complete len:560 (+),score=152.08 TRINITY_DN6361_c0_g1_i1:78-1757(+)
MLQHAAAAAALAAAAAAQPPLPAPGPFPHDTAWQLWTDVEAEHVEPVCGPVSGTVPSWLRGTKWGNGFGRFGGNQTVNGQLQHWEYVFIFDVLSVIWKWDIDGSSGRVCFQNTLQHSAAFNYSQERIPPFFTFGGTSPDMTSKEVRNEIAKALFPGPPKGGGGDNMVVNLQPIGGQLMAVSDMSGEMVIDPETTRNVGMFEWDDDLHMKELAVLQSISCAHPTPIGNYSFNYKVRILDLGDLSMCEYMLYRIDNTKSPLKREVVAKWRTKTGGVFGWPTYMHQFAVTENYVVFLEWPLFWVMEDALMHRMHIVDVFQWHPEKGTRVQVIKHTPDGKGELVHTMTTDPMFAYHHMNAFEDGKGNVIVDVATWPDASHLLGGTFNLTQARAGTAKVPPGNITRFTVPTSPEVGSTVGLRTTPTSIDLPVFDQGNPGDTRRRGKPYKWIYGISGVADDDWWNSIVKVDADTGLVVKRFLRVPHWPSEPVFIPRPGGTAEDDGVLLIQMLDADRQRCYLLGLEARTFAELFTSYAPLRCTFLSHGSFLPHGYSPLRPHGVMGE